MFKMFNKKGLSLLLVLLMICTMFVGLPMTVSAALDLPDGNIYDAEVLPDENIGAVYISGGNVNYGVFNLTTGIWTSENIGTGKDVALALDSSGNPHVAYIDSNDDLVYKYHDGTAWSSGETIDSISYGGVDGALTYPDIAIDGNGKAHIVYHDAKGGRDPSMDYNAYDVADLIYATNASGSFVKTVRSYSHGWFYSPDGWRNWAMTPSKIALTAGNYYIGIKQYNYYKWMGGQDHTYNYNLLLPPADPSNDLTYSIRSASTNNDLGFVLYEMGSVGTNVYSLFNKSGSLYITNGVTEIPAAAKAFSTVGADLFVDSAGVLYYAAINSTNLLLFQNGAFKESLTLPASLHSTHIRMTTVVSGSTQYVLYTDNTGKIRVHGVSTSSDSTPPSWLEALPNTSDATTTGFTASAGVDEPGTIYYLVVDRDATAPTASEVKAGINYGSVIKRASGNFAVLGNIADATAVAGLSATTDYDIYFVAQDNEGNLQNEPTIQQITTSSLSLSGSVAISGTLKYDETLTATVSEAQGDASLQYQWQRDGSDISGATNNTYLTGQDDISATISIVVTAANYSGSLTDTASSTIAKADGPAAPTGGTVDDTNDTFDWSFVTGIETATDYEYSVNGGLSWTAVTDKPINVGDAAISEGDLKVRVKATATHAAGAQMASTDAFTVAQAKEIDLTSGSIIIKNGAYSIGGGADVPNASNAYVITQTEPETPIANTIIVQTGVTATITLSGINISGNTPMDLEANSNVTLILADSTTNTLQGGTSKMGIGLRQNAIMTIDGTGTLSAAGGLGGSGIGHSNPYSGTGFTIIVNNGIITVTGNGAAAGINMYNRNVTINGGTITAIGGSSGGHGIGGTGGGLTINGGTVTAIGGDNNSSVYGASGIASGHDSPNPRGSVTITGGSVTAIGGKDNFGRGSGIGSSYGSFDLKIDNTAIVKAYSFGSHDAIQPTTIGNSGNGAITATILQGKFADAPNAEVETPIIISNNESPVITYNLSLPTGYKSFATTVSGGGTYTASAPTLLKNIAQSNYNTDFSITEAQRNNFTGLLLIAPPYTVTFDKNGGDIEASPQTKTVTTPATTVATLPSEPTKENHYFGGWWTGNGIADDGIGVDGGTGWGTEFLADTTVMDNITVYANWVQPISGIVAISGVLKYNETLTATVTGAQGDASLQYQWQRNGSDISGATNNTYLTVQDDISATISVVVTAANYTGSLSDTASSTIAKADGPAAPTSGTVDDTNNTFDWSFVTGIETATDYEYSVNGGSSWTAVTDKPINVGDIAIADGDLKVRVKASATHAAGSELASTKAFSAVTFSDSDADRVYFNGNNLSFNIGGLDALNGQTVRVAFGIVDQSYTFTPAAVINGLTALANDVQQFTTADITNGSFSTNITGSVQGELSTGIIAVQIFMDADGPGPSNLWVNALAGQPITFIALTAADKPAIVGISLPEGVTSIPVLGSGVQASENIYSMDIAFQKVIADGIAGRISFIGLDLIGNKEQLVQLSSGLTMLKEDAPGVGNLEEFTLGVDVETLTFLANTSAVVSVTSSSFNGRTSEDFNAMAADVVGGEVSNLSFDDSTDTVTFAVNHFSNYILSLTKPSCQTPLPTVSGTAVTWSAVTGAASYKVQIYQSDGTTPVGDEITMAADTTSYDLETINPALPAGDYKVKIMASGDGTNYDDSSWSDLSEAITIKNKVTLALRDGFTNPTTLLNNGNTKVFKFKISGPGIAADGDLNPDLKGKLTLAVCNAVNCTFNSGDVNAYILSSIDNDNVEAQLYISSTAIAGATASFDVTVSIGNLSATHKVGTPSTVSVSGVSVTAPPQSEAPETGDITVTRTSATEVNVTIANGTDGHTYKVYGAASGGSNIGMVIISMMGSTMSNVQVNSDVATIYVTKQDSPNHAESARTAKTIDTYITSISSSGNQTLPTLTENYPNGSQPTHTFIITNTGIAELTGVSIAISGAGSSNFTITQPNPTIAAGANTTFTVKANNGLAINTYTETITVSTINIVDKTFAVIQGVEALVLGLTDAEKVAVDKAALIWGAIKNTNVVQNGVTADLNLIVTGAVYGSAITWQSSDPTVISNSGMVTRPAYTNGDANVTVTATVYRNGVNDTKDFTFTVLKLAPSSNANLSGLTATAITLIPSFSSETNSYSASVGYSTSSTTITTTADSTATVKINGLAGASKAVALSVGSNTITIEVTAQDGTIKKTYTLNISRSSGGGSTSTPIPVSPVTITQSDNGKSTTTTITTNTTTNDTIGASTAKVEDSVMAELTSKAKEGETAGQKVTVEIKVQAATEAKAVAVEIPREAFNKVADETKAEVKVDAGLGTITFSEKGVETISGAADAGNISISITKIEVSSFTKEVQEKVGDRPVFDFSVKAGNSEISTFGGGNAKISIPYAPKTGEKKNAIIVFYIDNSGRLNPVRGKYDPATGTVSFKTTHFSQYAVGYNEVSYKDVADTAWYKEAVEFIAARSITLGAGNGNFSPDDQLTRGQYLVMMMRAYGFVPDENPSDNFADGGNTYYTGYLATAKHLGITRGVGNNLFAPDQVISRQEVFTLLYNALKAMGELPEATAGKTILGFRDADKIAPWAKDAMTLFTETGIISGNDGLLTPAATSTRAQMAQVLFNLLSK